MKNNKNTITTLLLPLPAMSTTIERRNFITPPHPNHYTPTRKCAKFLCSIFLLLLFVSILLLFIFLLIFRPHRPRFHISSLSFSTAAQSFLFILSLRNPNREIGVHYDTMSTSVFYEDRELGVLNRVLSRPFYQPPKNTTMVMGVVGVKSNEVTFKDGDVSVGLRLEFRSMVRFRVMFWNTKRHKMHVTCELEVGRDGNLLKDFKDKRCPIYF